MKALKLAACRQNHHTSPGDFASTLRPEPVLFDQLMLQASNVRILRRQFDRLSKGHDPINGLFRLQQGAVLFSRLTFKAKSLLQEELHLTNGIAAKHGNLKAFFLQVRQSPWLSLLLGLQGQYDVRLLGRPCDRCRHLQVINRAGEAILADPIRIDTNAFS